LNTVELLKKVRKIEIKTRGLTTQLFSGEYHSAFKGRGMSFAEVRPYQFGDDVRAIDWNVTARYNEPYIKIFEEERELTVMLLVDASRSGFFGTQKMFKNELMAEISAILSFSAISNQDKVGIMFFSDQVEKFIPPKKGKSHILRIIREIINFTPQHKKTNIKGALQFFTSVMKKKCIAFVLSDFMDTGYEDALKITGKKHDLAGISIYDPMEVALPKVGMMRMEDAETGEDFWIDTSHKGLRDAYQARQQEMHQYFRRTFQKNGVDFIDIATNQPYLASLHNFFKKRGAKR